LGVFCHFRLFWYFSPEIPPPPPFQTTLTCPDGKKKDKTFSFDACFDSLDPGGASFSGQEDVFASLGTDILDNAFNGYNACIFAYGQTGSGEPNKAFPAPAQNTNKNKYKYKLAALARPAPGKSFTMTGSALQPGLIPRLCTALFQRSSEAQCSAVQCSAVQCSAAQHSAVQ
jgi:kinesin family protein 13